MDINTIVEIVNSGGNLALILCAWWIHKAETELALIREALNIEKPSRKRKQE